MPIHDWTEVEAGIFHDFHVAWIPENPPRALLPEMPLFLRPDWYVNVPLESTYQEAYQGMRSFWRNVLEGWEPRG
jgi:hypothetical protein